MAKYGQSEPVRQDKLTRMKRQAKRQRNAAKKALIRNPRVQFADWLKREMPDVYADALVVAETSAAGMRQRLQAQAAGVTEGDQLGQWNLDFLDPVTMPDLSAPTVEKSFWQKFLDGAIGAGTAYLSLKNQKDILALNIERAKMGQPPIDAATTAPVIRTQVEIDPATARNLVSGIGSGINKNMLMIAGVALVALFLIMRK